MKTEFWMTYKKRLHVTLGAIFSNRSTLGAICAFLGSLPRFSGILQRFSQILSRFPLILPDFHQIKTFGGDPRLIHH